MKTTGSQLIAYIMGSGLGVGMTVTIVDPKPRSSFGSLVSGVVYFN